MQVLFDKNYVQIFNPTGQIVMNGYRHPTSRLYMIPLRQDDQHVPRLPDRPLPRLKCATVPRLHNHMLSAYEVQSVRSLINFFHRTCLSLPISEWIRAVSRNFLTTFPGLTVERIWKYCTKKIATGKGHLRLLPSNVRSTQLKAIRERTKHRRCGAFLIDENELKNLMGMDFAGRYPITSRRGNKYIFVLYDFDTNYINAVAIKSRKTKHYIAAF